MPTIEVEFGFTNQGTMDLDLLSMVIDMYTHVGEKDTLLATHTAQLGRTLNASRIESIWIKLPLHWDTIMSIEEARELGDGDVNVDFRMTPTYLYDRSDGGKSFAVQHNIIDRHIIASSEWVRNVYQNRFRLERISAESKTKLEQLKRTMSLRNLDEVIDEFYRKEIERKAVRKSE
jgi:hypothetical protein